MINQLHSIGLVEELNEKLNAFDYEIVKRFSHTSKNQESDREKLEMLTYLKSFANQVILLDEMTEHKRERINDSFRMWWSILAPSSGEGSRGYGSEHDRFVYHMIYIGDLFGYFDEENSVKAKDYLSKFSLDQVYQMQYSAVTRSETQQIVVDLFKKVYPDLQEEVLIDRFYVVDIYIPSENLCLEVQGPTHYNYAG